MIRLFARLSLVLVLLLSVVGTAYAADPDGSSPANAIKLSTSVKGTITGSKAGAFRYYTVDYPGNSVVGTIAFYFNPANYSTANSIGLTLWQSGKQLSTVNGYTLSGTQGGNKLTFASASKDPILVQLYYYEQPDASQPGKTVNYELWLSGLPTAAAAPAATAAPAAPAPVATAAPTTPPATATPASPAAAPNPAPTSGVINSVSGVLNGTLAGSYAVYTITGYPGDGSSRTLSLDIGNVGYNLSNAIFLNVYQDGKLIGSMQGSKVAKPGDPLVVTFSSKSTSPISVQVANYNPSSAPAISYVLTYSK